MRICLDLDGVVCRLKQPGETYATVQPVPRAIEKLRALRAAGHTIILMTARHMKTCEGNPGMAVARIGQITLDWLARHEVEYDEIHFGKPWADIYIDDNAFRFSSWDAIGDDGSGLPRSTEATLAEQRKDDDA
jgi:capsule biosynthesis phosphatase